MTERSVFVTGGFGMVGGWLVRALIDRGDRVTVLRRGSAQTTTLGLLGHECDVTVVDGDICDGDVLDRALGEHEVDTVFHLASQSIVPTANAAAVQTFETNIRGSWTLLDAARRHGVDRTVVAASVLVYGAHDEPPYREDLALQPRFPYDVSKAATDLIARSYWHTYGLPVAVTRFANVYGGGDLHRSRLVPEVVGAALDGRRPVIRSDGTPELDFLYVEDAVAAYLAIADALDGDGARGEAFNAGCGSPVSIGELVATVCRLVGADLTSDIRGTGTPHGEIDRQYVDIAKIERVCGWTPTTDLETGLTKTIDWYRSHPEVLGA